MATESADEQPPLPGAATQSVPASRRAESRRRRQPAVVASQRIAAILRDDILSGALTPGARLRQADIAGQLGASRLPVREALRILQAHGLVDLRPNHGAWVTSLNLDECQSVYKMRERLEPLALAESLPRLTGETLDRLDEIQRSIEANTDAERFLVLDRKLHLLCYSGNAIAELGQIIERFWDTTQVYRRAYVRGSGSERAWVVNAEHRLLLDAMRRGESVDAERILAAHIRRTRVSLVSFSEPTRAAAGSDW